MEPHDVTILPLCQEVSEIRKDLRELKVAVLGNGKMGIAQKTEHLWDQYQEQKKSNRDLYNVIYKGFVVGVLIYLSSRVGIPFNP